MKIINIIGNDRSVETPYDLKARRTSSLRFYEELNEITDCVIEKGKSDLSLFIYGYQNFSEENLKVEDVLLDFLILGVLWKEYARMEVKNLLFKTSVLRVLYRLRHYHPKIKSIVDILRGRLASQWLDGREGVKPKYAPSSKKRFQLLLSATCEFKEELQRIDCLQKYIESLTKVNKDWMFENLMNYTQWFCDLGKRKLSKYTSNVNTFRNSHESYYYGREDYFLSRRRESEYHLNMVGAQLMNRSLSHSFSMTKEKVLLLPSCMASGDPCKAEICGKDLLCKHCNAACKISQLTRSMQKEGVRTVIIQHSSKFSEWLKPWSNQSETGLIGVACVLNLLLGGFEMKRLNIPSQCVFLDFAGCKKHWISGKPTDLNTSQALKLINGNEAVNEQCRYCHCETADSI